MGFFSDLKEDLNQAVNELLPDGGEEEVREAATAQQPLEVPMQEAPQEAAQPVQKQAEEVIPVREMPAPKKTEIPANPQMDVVDDTLREIEELEAALKGIDELQEAQSKTEAIGMKMTSANVHETFAELEKEAKARAAQAEKPVTVKAPEEKPEVKVQETKVPERQPEVKMPVMPRTETTQRVQRPIYGASEGDKKVDTSVNTNLVKASEQEIDKSWVLDLRSMEPMDETAVITAGMRVKGDILSNGSADVFGEVYGNVQVKGKLNVTGKIAGNSKAEEILADGARINGDVISDGSVRIGYGTVVVGNVEGTEAVIAGAVKGMIDIKGPVIIDETAVVLGNVKAKSIQINNGARMEGMCVLCYAEQSAAKFFEEQDQ
ncbi:MAG: polymer-forming cytoskeletal protein [Lachnospiraceae bacterium]|nr:polymer-forming cytoskeletal protein [Lachnospiraceae bacterium]